MSGKPNRARTSGASGWLIGGGEMGKLIREMDWSKTPLGPVERWPAALMSTLGICLSARFPMAIHWRREGFLLYNDAWRPILGDKHPWALGRPACEVWPEIWDTIAPLFASVMANGEATWRGDELLLMHRFGYTEECYFDYTFNPIRGEGGNVEGILNVVLETTERVIGERRLRTLHDLGERGLAEAKTIEQACRAAAVTLAENPHDFPFALIYLLDEDGRWARLSETVNLAAGTKASPTTVGVGGAGDVWNFGRVIETGKSQTLENLAERFDQNAGGVKLSAGAWADDWTRRAIALPLAKTGTREFPDGFLVAGISPRLALDDDYRGFLELAAGHIATAIINARAYEDERRRAEALAELDRAKTAFFSNVSHEFRTPLTLMLGPLEDTLAEDGLPHQARDRLEVARRNSLRLLKLVNNLLDFSRIEAGRIEAVYEPVDLAKFTTDLASVFRSAIERAGLKLVVDCPPLSEPVYVDREMWEKVVLNLLSNAFKFTFEGEIEVKLRIADCGLRIEEPAGSERSTGQSAIIREKGTQSAIRNPLSAILTVRDTGTGIPEADLPRLFERFYRVKGARGRSYEGSGIGLALVLELVKLHCGEVRVESEVDRGSEFTVRIPLGKGHLPAERIGATRSLASTGLHGDAYVEEALRWLPEEDGETGRRGDGAKGAAVRHDIEDTDSPRLPVSPSPHSRVLLADDNADMREYVRRLLGGQYEVEAVADGGAALNAVRERMPDLVLADVMMPNLDGFGLLRELRADERLKTIPVILLSARAGEESRVEGMEAGADDYLIKPFSARELLARVEAHLKLHRARREAEDKLAEASQRLQAHVDNSPLAAVQFDPEWRITAWSEGAERMFGWSAAETLGKRIKDLRWVHDADADAIDELCADMIAGQRLRYNHVNRNYRKDGSVIECEWYNSVLRDANGKMISLNSQVLDITERKRAEMNVAFLAEISQDFARLTSVDDIMRTVGAKIGEYLNLSLLALTEINEDADEAVVTHDWHRDDAPGLVGVYRIGDFVTSEFLEASRAGELFVVCDTGADPRLNPWKFAALKPGSFASAPLVRDGQWRFLLVAFHSTAHDWRDDEIDLIRELTTRIWSQLERVRALEALRRSEERYRVTFDNAAVGIAHIDLDGRWLRFNDAVSAITGYSREELVTKTFADITHPDDIDADWALARQVLAGEIPTYSMEKRYLRKDGSIAWVCLTVSMMRDAAGAPHNFISHLRPIQTGRLLCLASFRRAGAGPRAGQAFGRTSRWQCDGREPGRRPGRDIHRQPAGSRRQRRRGGEE